MSGILKDGTAPDHQRFVNPHRTQLFSLIRPTSSAEVPSADASTVDVAILDMNHGLPNVGHDSIVRALEVMTHRHAEALNRASLSVRVISFDVRRSLMLPENPRGRYLLYVGTGGPGHLDPRLNRSGAAWSQGIDEDPRWEPGLFGLFDAIAADADAALIAVCHTFGLICRWSKIAEPRLRGPEIGGKSSGIRTSILTAQAVEHPWFSRFSEELPDGREFRLVDSRLFDMVGTGYARDVEILATESRNGRETDVVTMLELRRGPGESIPRILAANHHPEIIDRDYILSILDAKRSRGEVTDEWYHERADLFTKNYSPLIDRAIHATSEFTFLRPLEYHFLRVLRLRSEQLGKPHLFDESSTLASARPAAQSAAS